jgi:hypothetical protein
MKPEDFQTEAWRRFTQELEEQLASLRAKNDVKTLNESETSFLRGRIFEVKRILSLAKSDRKGDDPSGFE